jgi:tetratricopeptide (TPR) repeat protein
MSATSGTQISKPSKEQDFEDNCVVLWKCILNDPNVQKVGRRGQKQQGVDLYGYRNGRRDHLVGLQCKLKTGNKALTETEVRGEFNKALEFEPIPREYFILTTADDDQAMQALCRKLTAEQAKNGVDIVCYVWGWGTICDEASKHPDALNAFDPTYGPHGKLVLDRQNDQIRAIVDLGEQNAQMMTQLATISSAVSTVALFQPGGATSATSAVEVHLDREIDNYRELTNNGKAKSALSLFENLLNRVEEQASGRIIFRIKANIGNCLMKLGRIDEAADRLLEASNHAPNEPKAISNRAYGFLLKQNWKAVLDIGRDSLISNNGDEYLSSHVIQAAKFETDIDDPLSLIPAAHKDTAPVQIAYVDFIRGRLGGPEWWKQARTAASFFPSDSHLQQFAAEAVLDEATKDPHFLKTGLLKESFRKPISATAKLLRDIWGKSHEADGPPDEEAITVLCNLLTALKLLGDMSEVAELVQQGIDSGTSESTFYLKAAIIAMETGASSLNADDLLAKVDDSPEKKLIQVQRLAFQGDWETLASYTESDIDALPETEREPFATLVEMSKITIGPQHEVASSLSQQISETAISVRAYTIIADFSMKLDCEDLADEAYEKARSIITDDTHYSGRSMLAGHAFKRERWSDTVDLLINHVNQNADNDDLRKLCTALANERPIRKRAVTFFSKLPAEIRQLPRYQHSEGFLHYYRGELKLAEKLLRKAIKEKRADDILLLISVLRQRGNATEAKEVLTDVPLEEIKGDPAYVMAIVREALQTKRAGEALEFGYRLARQNRNDPQVAQAFTSVIFRAADLDLLSAPSVVSLNSTFKLESGDGRSIWLTIEGEEDRVNDGFVSSRNTFAVNSLGHPVGFCFHLRHGFNKNQEWTIREIKHKYLFLFHDIMENFESEFPGVSGISSIPMTKGDVEPVLSEIRRAAESSQRLSELYTESQIPLAAVAAHLRRDPISFANYVKEHGNSIVACVGRYGERYEALEVVKQHRAAGAVLDTYTAWTAACLDLFGVLTKTFGQIVIPISVVHDLHHLLGNEEYDPRQAFTLLWRDGEYYKYEQTREEFETRRDFIKDKIKLIEKYCTVVPVDAPDAGTDTLAKLVELFGPAPFNAGAIAASGYLLVSEDSHYRQWIEDIWSSKGVWLQVVLDYALQVGVIDLSEYAASIGGLAEFNHGFLYLDGPTIHAMIGDGKSTNWSKVQAVTRSIGTSDADIVSHVNVIVNFVHVAIRAGDGRALHFEKTLGMLLEKLTRERTDTWHHLVWHVYEAMPQRLRSYILDWVRGHFLDPQIIVNLQSHYARETAGYFANLIIKKKQLFADTVIPCFDGLNTQ